MPSSRWATASVLGEARSFESGPHPFSETILFVATQPTLPVFENLIRLSGLSPILRDSVTSRETKRALLAVVGDYQRALGLLDDYDHQRVRKPAVIREVTHPLHVAQARRLIEDLRKQFGASNLFGREKDQSLDGTLGAIMQTFNSQDLYPGLEEKAARLLYFTVKNHHFVDGNKRIAAVLFLWFLDQNGGLVGPDGTHSVSPDALVALTLLAAESRSSDAEVVVRLIMHMLAAAESKTPAGAARQASTAV